MTEILFEAEPPLKPPPEAKAYGEQVIAELPEPYKNITGGVEIKKQIIEEFVDVEN